MSHFTTLRTELRNLEALAATLSRLGYRSQPNGTVTDYYGQKRQVDLTVEIPGQRAVGFARSEETSALELVGDWWNAQLSQQEFLDTIKHNYAREQVLASLEIQGVDLSTVRQIEEEDGTVVFEVPIDDSQIQAMANGG